MKIVNYAGFRDAANKRLPHFLFEYIDGGSYDEHTLRRNVSDFKKVTLRQKVLRDVSNINTATTLFGKPMAMPLTPPAAKPKPAAVKAPMGAPKLLVKAKADLPKPPPSGPAAEPIMEIAPCLAPNTLRDPPV